MPLSLHLQHNISADVNLVPKEKLETLNIKSVIRGEEIDVSREEINSEAFTGIVFKELFLHVNLNVYY